MPYPSLRAVDVAQIEAVLLSMYAIPTIMSSSGPAVQIITHIAPTCDEVERIRGELHAADIGALVERTRVEERSNLRRAGIYDLDARAVRS